LRGRYEQVRGKIHSDRFESRVQAPGDVAVFSF
jgi:hypothetical protein